MVLLLRCWGIGQVCHLKMKSLTLLNHGYLLAICLCVLKRTLEVACYWRCYRNFRYYITLSDCSFSTVSIVYISSHQGPSIKYVTLFLANFDPPPPCHTLSHIPGPPRFLCRPSTKIPDKTPLYKFYLNCSRRFLSEGFCPGWFLSVPPSVTIHLLQHHFKFHVSYVW